MQRLGIEVGSIGPHRCVDPWLNKPKSRNAYSSPARIGRSQWSVECVVEADAQGVMIRDLEGPDSVNCVIYGSIGIAARPSCNPCQSALIDQAPLPLRH
jgi:hypothetical protein